MKNGLTTGTFYKFFFLLSALIVSMLAIACEKSVDAERTDLRPPVEPEPQLAYLSVIHASPGSPSFNFYFDSKLVNTNELNYLSKINYFRSGKGIHGAKVANSDLNKELELITDSIDLSTGNYSLFVTGKAGFLEYLLVEDNLNQPAAGKAKLRFIHLSPDAGPLNLALMGQDPHFHYLSYKNYSTYEEVAAGTYTFNLREASSGKVAATLPNVILQPGAIYSYYASGLSNTTVKQQKLGIKVVRENLDGSFPNKNHFD